MLKARPTTYRGIDMKSRLEARVARVLDENGGRWTYEPRAFAGLHGEQYLPDFEVTSSHHWDEGFHLPVYLEVKPTQEAALRALPRMQVIRESRLCTLALAYPNEHDELRFAVDCMCSYCACMGYAPDRPIAERIWKVHHCTERDECHATYMHSDVLACGHVWGYALGSETKVRCSCGMKL